MLFHLYKITFRNILRHKTHSLISLFGLGVGMMSCLYITLWVEDELNWDKFHQNYDQLYRFISKMDNDLHESTPLALVPNLKGKFPEIDKMTRFSQKKYDIRLGNVNSNQDGALIDREFFDIFSFPLVKGDVPDNFDNSLAIVITENLANKYFINENPIGKSLVVDNGKQFVITGILKDVAHNSHIRFDFLLPIRPLREGADLDWSYDCMSYFTLNKNANIADLQNKIAYFISENDKVDSELLLEVQPFQKIHLYSLNGSDPIVYIYILITLALTILFIASVNFVNLSTSRFVFRAREIGVRKVVGAEKKDIIVQFIGESITLSLMGLFISIIGATIFYPVVNQFSGKQIALIDFVNIYHVLGALAFGVLTGLGSGIYPALLLSSIVPIQTIRGKFQYTTGGKLVRRVFVASQFIVTVILIVITSTMHRQLNYIWNLDLGFKKDQVLSVPMNDQLLADFEVFKESLIQNSQIRKVASAYNNPTNIFHTNLIDWENNTSGTPISINDQSVDYDYFDLFEMDIIQGRAFSKEFPGDVGCFILNEEALRLTGYSSPIGRLITVWKKQGPIVGVVKNFHSSPLHEKIKPIVFMLSQRHGPRTIIFIKLSTQDINGTIEFIKRKASELAPDYQFEYTFLDEVFAGQYSTDQRMASLYRVFSILAILISCLGLYGLVSLSLSTKTKEFGIRKALGASVIKIVLMVLKEYMIIISISTFIGWSISFFLVNRMLENYAYKTSVSLLIFFASWIIILLLAMVSILGKVIKVALTNPVDSLKYD